MKMKQMNEDRQRRAMNKNELLKMTNKAHRYRIAPMVTTTKWTVLYCGVVYCGHIALDIHAWIYTPNDRWMIAMYCVCGENTVCFIVVVFMSYGAKSGGFDATTLFKFSNISFLLGVEQDTCKVVTLYRLEFFFSSSVFKMVF